MPRLRPRARIVRTIGDQLISGPEAALVELVKNAYDADSPYVLIKVFPRANDQEPSGCISVSDAGHGMSPDDVIGKWLEPATSEKLERRFSPGGRAMLGAKGIGRFSASRLGTLTTLESVHKSETQQTTQTTVDIDWSWFQSAKYLDEIDIPLTTKELAAGLKDPATGVTLTIRDLRDTWTKKRLEALIRELRRLAPPPDSALRPFRILLDLTEFRETVHGFNGQDLLRGLNFNTDEDSTDADDFLIRPFALRQHADYVLRGTFASDGTFDGEFIVQRGDNAIQQLTVRPPAMTEEEESCGPLAIQINIYDREKESIEALFTRMGVPFDKVGIQAARRTITDNAGVSIFRKGFRVRPYGDPDNDWLELERQRVQNPSRKLGLSQVSGAIEIADDDVSCLIERSSREGLEHNGSFERLKHLVLNVLLHAEQRRFDFREKAGLSRRPKGGLAQVRESANLRRVSQAVQNIPVEFRKQVEAAIQKDAAAIANDLSEIDEYQQALQSRAALGLVVAEVLHEGRRILNPVSSSAKALSESADWVLEQSRRGEVFRNQFPGYAATIYDGVRSLAGMFKKLDPISGRRRGRPKHFSVRGVIERSVSLFRDQTENGHVEVSIDCSNSIEAYGYDQDLQAALMNLIDNAIYWLSHSTAGHRKIDVECSKKGKWITLRVANNGPTIDEAYVPRLFDAGFTLKTEGTGLGLAIAREALRRSQGDLLYDEDAHQTTFVIRLRTDDS